MTPVPTVDPASARPVAWCTRLTTHRKTVPGKGEPVDHSALRTRCQNRVDRLLRDTGIPQPWNINDFIDRLEQHRGREIDLCAHAWTAGDSSGAWQRRADHDVVAYPANTSGFHQDHIILHEIGHMISEHQGHCVLSEQEARRLAPDLGGNAFAHLLERDASDTEEREAEMIATLIHQRARERPVIAADAPDASARHVARVDDVFGG